MLFMSLGRRRQQPPAERDHYTASPSIIRNSARVMLCSSLTVLSSTTTVPSCLATLTKTTISPAKSSLFGSDGTRNRKPSRQQSGVIKFSKIDCSLRVVDERSMRESLQADLAGVHRGLAARFGAPPA